MINHLPHFFLPFTFYFVMFLCRVLMNSLLPVGCWWITREKMKGYDVGQEGKRGFRRQYVGSGLRKMRLMADMVMTREGREVSCEEVGSNQWRTHQVASPNGKRKRKRVAKETIKLIEVGGVRNSREKDKREGFAPNGIICSKAVEELIKRQSQLLLERDGQKVKWPNWTLKLRLIKDMGKAFGRN